MPIDAEALGEFVGGFEANAPNVGGQTIWVGAHEFDGLIAVGFVDAHRFGRADAVRLQKDDDAAHGLLFVPAFADELQTLGADALDFLQKRGAFVDDLQGAGAEDLDDFAREMRADAFHQTGAEILFDAVPGVRWRAAHLGGLELLAVFAVVDPLAGRFEILSRDDAGEMADDRDQTTTAARLHAQHGKARVGLVKGDALNDRGKCLSHVDDSTGSWWEIRSR